MQNKGKQFYYLHFTKVDKCYYSHFTGGETEAPGELRFTFLKVSLLCLSVLGAQLYIPRPLFSAMTDTYNCKLKPEFGNTCLTLDTLKTEMPKIRDHFSKLSLSDLPKVTRRVNGGIWPGTPSREL